MLAGTREPQRQLASNENQSGRICRLAEDAGSRRSARTPFWILVAVTATGTLAMHILVPVLPLAAHALSRWRQFATPLPRLESIPYQAHRREPRLCAWGFPLDGWESQMYSPRAARELAGYVFYGWMTAR